MLPDVGMVQMYSKSANVNDLGLHGQAGPPLCMDRPSSLFLWVFCQVVVYLFVSYVSLGHGEF